MSGEAPPVEPDERRTGLKGLVQDVLAFDRGALAILVAVPITLTLLDYYGMPWHYPRHEVRRQSHSIISSRRPKPPLADVVNEIEVPGPRPLRQFVWWGAACLLFLVGLPYLTARFFAKLSFRDLGVKLKGTARDIKTYALLFVIFFPVIWLVSKTKAFQHTYPFYVGEHGELGSDFLIFEVIYCLQFFAVEFFFRGFMVLGLKRYIGWASVLVMLAPYCMIHFYKPMPEAMGAIGAGLVLGTLSWRTGTILYGWALHYSVALSMDLLALDARGLL